MSTIPHLRESPHLCLIKTFVLTVKSFYITTIVTFISPLTGSDKPNSLIKAKSDLSSSPSFPFVSSPHSWNSIIIMRFIFLGLLTLSFMGHQLAARLQRRAPEKPGDGHDDSEFVNAVDCISVWRPPFESTTGDVSPSDRWCRFFEIHTPISSNLMTDWIHYFLIVCDDTACLLNSCTGK